MRRDAWQHRSRHSWDFARDALEREHDAVADGSMNVIWEKTLATLDNDGVSVQERAFLSLAKLVGLLDDTALVAAPNDFTKEIVETRLRERIIASLTESLGHPVRLAVTVDHALVDAPTEEPERTERGERSPGEDSVGDVPDQGDPEIRRALRRRELDGIEDDEPVGSVTALPLTNRRGGVPEQVELTRLNPKYTFETFVIGDSNRFAHAAATAVGETPARAYNPLFIYGDSGLGKTHLLHAIGHYSRNLYSHLKVRYVNSEEFTNDFINSIRDDKAANFQRRYRDVDVLLIDDIQFLQGKEQTQEEFFHTFNTLHNANKQVVITSDVPPRQLAGFEERMRSRFEWGLLTDVQPPHLETREAILRKKAIQERLHVPADVIEFIATRITTNIRELEGALIRVTAFANLNRQPVDMALAEIVLKDLIPSEGGEITSATIMAQVASYFGLTLEDLRGSSRSRVLVTARQIAMYLCRELTSMSLPEIGKEFNKDHTTVMHANKKIGTLMAERRAIYNNVTELTGRIKLQSR